MKKIYIFVIVFVSLNAFAGTQKMDLMLHSYVKQPSIGKAMLGKSVAVKDGVEEISVIVKSKNTDETAWYVESVGGGVSTVLGDIMVVSIPSDYLEMLSDRNEVVSIEGAKPMVAKMNHARVESKVNSVESSLGLIGTNVLVGIIDETVDYAHPDFNGRIQYLNYHVSGTEVECSNAGVEEGRCEISTGGGSGYHGTHVTGIAAGSDGTYTGAAKAAGIAFYSTTHATTPDPNSSAATSMSTVVLDGISRLIKFADNVKKPIVINMSLGTSIGAHDGTSLLEQGVDNALSGKQGRIIVNAAGNETVNPLMFSANRNLVGGIHAAINISSGESKGWKMKVVNQASISKYALSDGTNSFVLADVWLSTGSLNNCTIEAKAYADGAAIPANTSSALVSTAALPFTADVMSNEYTDNKARVQIGVDSQDSQNSKPHAQVYFGPSSSGAWSSVAGPIANGGYALDIIIRATGGTCTGDIWLYPDQTALMDFYKNIDTITVGGTGGYKLADGDSNKIVTIPGTANNIITAASYMQPTTTWTGDDGGNYDQTANPLTAGGEPSGGTAGSVSLFSSLGPTADGRQKPDVAAPGEPIISTLASSCKTGCNMTNAVRIGGGTHLKLEGTSMSSPLVAGVIALMLEKNNCLTYTEAGNALRNTASQSGAPDYLIGYGKINASSAASSISSGTSCYSGTGNSTDADLPGGGGGGGSSGKCSLTSDSQFSLDVFAMIVLCFLSMLVWRYLPLLG